MKAKKVIAVEIDRKLIPILTETLSDCPNVEILNQDILKTDVNEIIERERKKEIKNVKILGNLPYYITTPILMKLLEDGVEAESITVMMQKEVAERIQSLPGKKTYGAISVAVQYYCEAQIVTYVPRDVFIPQPNVDSAVLKLTLRKEKPAEVKDRGFFLECVRAGFSQRRKTLANSLTSMEGVGKELAQDTLKECGIESSRRAETLSLDEFAVLAEKLKENLEIMKGR